ncbi:hypothetical protein EPA93_38910 [Ktedonosporobacter rubrisoli]|uniref:Putative sensor domain-containing protein n=1 Tax=Ktedonosporobacter rubrisoli TaxID=2509675 RepID=A0A4P6K2C1_KTERU|nr:sensor domain-containing protein [Ktedonosporobacter rubrisoli]QBD81626.1 hypothetical protein EPA93_38910 [Ktedonosporobacter rubrisoli]
MVKIYNSERAVPFIGKISFLVLSCPLGLFYFLTIFTGFTLSIATLVIGVGFPLLERTCAVVHALANWERQLIASTLRLYLPKGEDSYLEQTWRQRLRSFLSASLTWKRCFYFLLKVPLGLLSFCLILPLFFASAVCVLTPLFYLVGTYFLASPLSAGAPAIIFKLGGIIQLTTSFNGTMFARSLAVMGAGFVGSLLTYLLVNGLVALSERLARALLTVGQKKSGCEEQHGSHLDAVPASTLSQKSIW